MAWSRCGEGAAHSPSMGFSPQPAADDRPPARTSGDVDATARSIAEALRDGLVADRVARQRLARIALASTIPRDVAADHALRHGWQAVNDLADNILADLLDWITKESATGPDGQPRFQPLRMVNSSFAGWLRQTANAFARFDPIVTGRGRSDVTLVDLYAPDGTDGLRDLLHDLPAPVDVPVEDPKRAQLVQLAALTEGSRPGGRMFALASALRRTLDLPALCIPPLRADRDVIVAQCLADPSLADRARRSAAALAGGDIVRSGVGEHLLALWDNFSPEQMDKLDDYSAAMTHALVVGQVATMPKPSREAVRVMRRVLRDSGPRSRDWSRMVTDLVDCWLARTTNPVSEFDDTSTPQRRVEAQQRAVAAAARWPQVAVAAAGWVGHPVGVEVQEVWERVGDAFSVGMQETHPL